MRLKNFFPVLPVILLLAACSRKNPDVKELLATFSLPEEFRIELFAAEPLIADPVDMEIDEEGRLYVVEMPGYPLDVGGSGKVKILRDTDGDGYPDKSTLFADDFVLPNSIMRWKNGVLVTDAPDLIYLEDTDGDDVADVRQVILTGFALSNPQHNLNSPLYGPDNWIYLAHESSIHTVQYDTLFGDRGKEITYADVEAGPALPQNANGKSVRLRPDTHELEILSSRCQFGQSFDATGRHFLVDNSHHIFQEIIAERYVERNPGFLGVPTMAFIPEDGNAATVYPTTKNAEHQMLTDVGVFTSACGLTIYSGGLFPDEYNQASFVAEPVHNLVHVDRLDPNGPARKADRLFQDKEFLTSTDPWFRPVNFYVGPDGALYVVDYYRRIIEHPEWMADEVVKSGELYEGSDRGRIFRILPESNYTKPAFLGKTLLDKSNATQLVSSISNPNYWWRINAQRLLVDLQDQSVVTDLADKVRNDQNEIESIHALWTLHGLNRLVNEDLLAALKSRHEGVVRSALQIAEARLDDDSVANEVVELHATDDEVLFQQLLSLGDIDSEAAAARRRTILFDHLDNAWMASAALTAKGLNTLTLWDDLIAQMSSHPAPEGATELFRRLGAMLVRESQQEKVARIASSVGDAKKEIRPFLCAAIQGAIGGPGSPSKEKLRGLLSAGRMAGNFGAAQDPDEFNTWRSVLLFLAADSAKRMANAGEVGKIMASLAADEKNLPAKRSAALEALSAFDPQTSFDFAGLIRPQTPGNIQVTALRILGRQRMTDPAFSRFVVEGWRSFSPEVREEAMTLMMDGPVRRMALLDAIDGGTIAAAAVGWRRSVSLMETEDSAVRNKARVLLDQFKVSNEQMLAKFEGVEAMAGDAASGKQVFAANCGICHQVSGQGGTDFGPDLASIRNQNKQAILVHILEPNKAIADGYELWTIKMKSGDTYSGVISGESPNALQLKTATGESLTIARTDVTEITSSTLSAMPEGLGSQITRQQMADLLEFLKGADSAK